MMKCRYLSWALMTTTAAGALFFGGCATPEKRISQNPDLYHSLPVRQQQLVAQGQIAPGMSRNAVWLAWGGPEQKVNGYARGNSTETWVYLTTTTYPYGYGWGGPGYGWGGPGWGWGGPGWVLGRRRWRISHPSWTSLRRLWRSLLRSFLLFLLANRDVPIQDRYFCKRPGRRIPGHGRLRIQLSNYFGHCAVLNRNAH